MKQGSETTTTDSAGSDIRERVRERYAAAAVATAAADSSGDPGCGCECECAPSTSTSTSDAPGQSAAIFGSGVYDSDTVAVVPPAAVSTSLGCGVPTAVADLRPGETVLDLGSGGGADVLISADRVGPAGRVIGLDMTDEMLRLARRHASEAGAENVEFVRGYLEDIPLPNDSVDVVISNCVINLTADKTRVLREAARVLRPGGRLALSDVVADADMDDATRADMEAWTGCIAGALTRDEFTTALSDAGLIEIEITDTHRVHPSAVSAMIRARKP